MSLVPLLTVLMALVMWPNTVPMAMASTLCNATSHCGPYATCFNGICTCLIDFQPASHRIGCERKLGSKCNTTGECGLNAQCSTEHRRCLCMANYHEVNNTNQCQYAKHRLGGDCTADKECGLEATCRAGRCQCKSKHVAEVNQIDCRPSRARLGSLCDPAIDMCGERAICRNLACKCLRGFVAAPNGVDCVPTYDIPCDSSADCGRFSQCINGSCLCQRGAQRVNGQCAIVLSPHDSTMILTALIGLGIIVILLFSVHELLAG